MTAAIVAAHFLAGSLMSTLIPIGLLILVAIYWVLLLRRRATGARSGKVE